MDDRTSLADKAVEALGAIARMDAGLGLAHDCRHQVRTLKRLAERTIEDALRHARELAYLADDMRAAEECAARAALAGLDESKEGSAA